MASSPLKTVRAGRRAGVVEGMQFDRGYLSPFINKPETGLSNWMTHSSCWLTRKSPTSAKCCRCWKVFAKPGKPLIIAEDVEGEALATLVVNTMRGIVKVAAVKAPGLR